MKKDLIYEGKAKRIYSVKDKENLYIQEFKDDATAFNGLKKDQIKGKGEINADITAKLFGYLEDNNIPTHFLEKISPTEMLVKAVSIIKVEVVCRNIAAGSLVKKLGFLEGHELSEPIVEYYFKSDEFGDPLFNDSHITAMNLATREDLEVIKEMTFKINILLKRFFENIGIKLVDFKLEFGKDKKGNIILADEISPDTCRFWDKETNKKLDKDRFRFDLGDVESSYKEIRNRIFNQ
jgi:phosphoribosylaminoimidazole-succinocarboxamide synthase